MRLLSDRLPEATIPETISESVHAGASTKAVGTLEQWANLGTAVFALVAAVLGLGQYWRFRSRRDKQEAIGRAFADAVKGLGADSPVERVASAALTRRFFDRESEYGLRGLPYASHAVRVISAVLRSEPTGPTQKLLADGLREAPSLSKVDLQRANLQNCYWGPGNDDHLVDASGADFFGADLSAASLRGANLQGAKFRNSQLCGTTLEDADCTEADFRGADLRGARFGGAHLQGARFSGARGIPAPIIEALDQGVFTASGRVPRTPKPGQKEAQTAKVFISAPSRLTTADNVALQQVILGISRSKAEVIRHLPAAYGVSAPLSDVTQKIRDCVGVVIFGPPQFAVTGEGDARSTTSSDLRVLSTPWNQLEAGIAYALEKPLLILFQGAHGGVFDIPDNPNTITVVDATGDGALVELSEKTANWVDALRR